MARRPPSDRIRRSWQLDRDQVEWLERKAVEASANATVVLRQVVRAAMNAEQQGGKAKVA